MFKCPKCRTESPSEFTTERGLKHHLTAAHGSWVADDLRAAGIEPTAKDIARNVSGRASSAEVTAAAPETEPKPGETTTKTTRRRKPEDNPEVIEAQRLVFLKRCKAMAAGPYRALAILLKDEAFALTKIETDELATAYMTLAEAYGWEGKSRFLLWSDILLVHASILCAGDEKKSDDLPKSRNRREAFKKALGLGTPSEESDLPKES